MNKLLISVKKLTLDIEKNRILDDVSFDVREGEYIAIVGPNGSGKSTLVKLITGALKQSFGGKIDYLNIEKNDIGYLPQMNSRKERNFPGTVREIVSTGLLSKKHFTMGFRNRQFEEVDEILKTLEIFNLKEKGIRELSGGQEQRVLLARAMASEPKVLFLDEPTSALDPNIRNEFYSLLKKLNREKGITIILVSHDLESVLNNADKILYLDTKVVFFGNRNDYGGF